MKKITFLIIATVFLFTSAINAQTSITGNTTAARLIVPLGITLEGDQLNFGDLVLVDVASATTLITIDVDTDNTVTSAVDAQVLPVGDAGRRATFEVTGEQNLLFDITVPTISALVDAAAVGVDIVVSAFTFSPGTDMADDGASDDGTSYKITAAGGVGRFTLGASMTVAQDQSPGVYAGTYTVTVTYQ
jgi:spore coat protein U-like protein